MIIHNTRSHKHRKISAMQQEKSMELSNKNIGAEYIYRERLLFFVSFSKAKIKTEGAHSVKMERST